MNLLSPSELAEIRNAIHDVADTFFKTPVVYQIAGTTLSRFSEDRRDNTEYELHTLSALVEYSLLVEDKYTFTPDGAVEDLRVKVTFNVDDLVTEGAWDDTNNIARFTGTKDKMFINGKDYRIVEIAYEGPLEAKNIHCIVFGEPRNRQTT